MANLISIKSNLLVLILLLTLLSCQSRYVNNGLSSIEKGNYKSAIRELEKEIKANPNNVKAYTYLGYAYLMEKEYHKASSIYAKAWKINPSKVDKRIYGEIEFQAGIEDVKKENYNEAKTHFTMVTNLLPKWFPGFIALGYVNGRLNKEEEMLSAYKIADELSPQNTQTAYNSAGYYLRNNKYSKSLPYLQKVAKNNPNNATTSYILGLLYVLVDNYDESILSLEHSIKIDPTYIDAYILLGEIYYHQQNFAKASVIYEKLASLKKDDSNIYCWWGISLLKMGNIDSAMNLFKKAIEIDSTNIEAYYCMGYAYLENGQADEAYKIFRYVEKIK